MRNNDGATAGSGDKSDRRRGRKRRRGVASVIATTLVVNIVGEALYDSLFFVTFKLMPDILNHIVLLT